MKKEPLPQLCLFSETAMQRMERIQPVKKKRAADPAPGDRPQLTDAQLQILAMQACMDDSGWDGPETAQDICRAMGLI